LPTIGEALQHGWQLQQQGSVGQAESIYRQVIAQAPRSAEAHVYLGLALFDQRRFAESEASYRAGLAIQQHFPIAWNNLGNTLRMQNKVEAADECFARAIEQQPDYLSPFKNRGTLWIWAGEIQRGLRWYEQALQIAPDEAELHRNLGVIYLLQGRFEEGWAEYRYRWKLPGLVRPTVPALLWQGEALAGKTILLYPEQGLGDLIHFVRMAEVLQQQGAHTILTCEPKMVPLLASARGIDQLCPASLPADAVDYHASLIEVADHLQIGRTNVPANVPYLSVPETHFHQWRAWMSPYRGYRVGICWQGNPQHHADVYRSLPLEQFADVAGIPGVSLFSLQHGFGSEQVDQVSFGSQIVRLPADFDRSSGAFVDTAAVIQSLDLVITSDTSTAHLAGALGVPTWLLLGKVPDWRWLLNDTSTAWYPTMRLFRQASIGDWQAVMREVAAKLESLVHGREATD